MQNDDLVKQLKHIREKRGYLLPHHGLMAISMPSLLEAYDQLYSNLTLVPRHLSKHEHEFVWMAVLVAMHEALGTHHIPRYLEAGGTLDEFGVIVSITALAKGSDAFHFVDQHWMPHLAGFQPEQSYTSAFEQLCQSVPKGRAHMAAAAVHMCTGNWNGLSWQIKAAYQDGVDEVGLAEALSLAMFPGSVPNFVEAAEVWRALITEGHVDAGDAFKTWAQLSGQGGYDQASGVSDGES